MAGTEAIGIFQAPRCPVCSSDRFMPWRWNGLALCVGCGYVRKLPTGREEPSEAIQRTYFNTEFALQDDHFTRFYESLNAKRRLRELKKLMPAGRVLEVGVGHGTLLSMLRGAGYHVEGIDLSPAVCAAVLTRYELAVHCATLEAIAESTPAYSYDLIIMCHVLEHVEELSPTLHTVSRLLNKDGLLYLAVPNVSAWNACLPGWTGYEPYHVHYFRPATLRRTLNSAGFKILYERTFEPLSGWFNTIVRSACHGLPALEISFHNPHNCTPRTGLVWVLYNIVRIMTGILLSPLRWLQSNLGYGEELTLIARANRNLSRTFDGA